MDLHKEYKKKLIFIHDNELILNDKLKVKIISIIKTNIDDTSTIFKHTVGNTGTTVNMKEILKIKPEIINNIYSLVHARVVSLSKT